MISTKTRMEDTPSSSRIKLKARKTYSQIGHRRVTNPALEEDKPPPVTTKPRHQFKMRKTYFKRALSNKNTDSDDLEAVNQRGNDNFPVLKLKVLGSKPAWTTVLAALLVLLSLGSLAESNRYNRYSRMNSRARLLASLPRQGRGSRRGKIRKLKT